MMVSKAKRLLPGLLALVFPMLLTAQTVDVTVRFNSATVQDTLSENHFVQMRGELNGAEGALTPGGDLITWSNTSTLIMENVGGDYWEKTFTMNADDTLAYKFWTGFDANTGTAVVWDGWEGSLSDPNGIHSGNRILITGAADTVLDLQFYNSSSSLTRPQYWHPYVDKPDTQAVYFRVNMAGQEESTAFDPTLNVPVTVEGGPPLGLSDWSVSLAVLAREATTGNASSFWSGTAYIAEADLAGGEFQNFKFVFDDGTGGQVWESIGNRWFELTHYLADAGNDTTIHWAYFNNQAPTGLSLVQSVVTWPVDPGAMETMGYFSRSIGDALFIDGAHSWDWADALELTFQPLVNYWIGQDVFTKIPGEEIVYKYVIQFDESRLDVNSPNYIAGLDQLSERRYWEESGATGGADRRYSFRDATSQTVPGDFGRDFQYLNGIPPEGVIEDPISVTFNINMAPAADSGINTTNPLFRPGVDSVLVVFEGSLMALSQGMSLWDDILTRSVNLTDLDGDLVYSATLDLAPPVVYQAGFVINYGTSADGWIGNGGGVELGRRHFQFIRPESHTPGGETVWPASYNFPTLDWIDWPLTVEDPPDFSMVITGMDADGRALPNGWRLSPAYPNPFNPSTTVNYQVPQTGLVNLTVYDLRGDLVRILVHTVQPGGSHSISWNGVDDHGKAVASGVYIIELLGAQSSQVQKITLLR